MGKVLLIDEAYRLAEGGYATEAMDELVDCMTKPKFARKLVIVGIPAREMGKYIGRC